MEGDVTGRSHSNKRAGSRSDGRGTGRRRRRGQGKPTLPTPHEWERRRRRRNGLIAAVTILAIALLAVADHRGWFLYEGDDRRRFDGRWMVLVDVLDPVTLRMKPAGRPDAEPVEVVLWGLRNTPDTPGHPGTPGAPGTPTALGTREHDAGKGADEANPGMEATRMHGKAVTEQIESMLEQKPVRVELAPHRTRDAEGRLLSRLHLPDGTVVNELLLREGYLLADEAEAHGFAERYRLLQRQARQDGRGRWGR